MIIHNRPPMAWEHNRTTFTSQTRMCPSVPPVNRRLMSLLNRTTFWRGSWGFRSDDTSAMLVTETSSLTSFKSDSAPLSFSLFWPFRTRCLTSGFCSLFPAKDKNTATATTLENTLTWMQILATIQHEASPSLPVALVSSSCLERLNFITQQVPSCPAAITPLPTAMFIVARKSVSCVWTRLAL